MKMFISAAIAATLLLGGCSQGGQDANAGEGEAKAAAPAGLARTAFAGLPESCLVLADKLDRMRVCAKKMVEGQVSPEDAAAEEASAKARAESMATDLRKLPAAEAAEACTANHELTDEMSAVFGDC